MNNTESSDLLQIIDNRVKKYLSEDKSLHEYSGIVTSVVSSTKCKVRLAGYSESTDPEFTFINKSGEILSAGDYVYIKTIGTDLNTGVISQKFGETGVLRAYPVGSIYMSVNSTSPATLFGGTWTRIQNRFLLAAGSSYAANTTGGEATHKLTVSEIPSHNHSERFCWSSTPAAKNTLAVNGTTLTATNSVSGVAGIDRGDSFGNYSGGSSAHNNMPPYLAVYVWKRTA